MCLVYQQTDYMYMLLSSLSTCDQVVEK